MNDPHPLVRSADRLRHALRRPLARTPYVWDAVMLARPDKRVTLARRDSALVLEGFLRSGNTFSVAAFAQANGDHLHVGRHLHAAAHVLRAVRLGLPTVVLVRPPRPAVLSYLVRRPTLTARDAAVEYVDFYRTAWPVRHGFVTAPFDRVVQDFGAVLRAVNERFGTTFRPYVPTPEADAAALRRVEDMNREECRGELRETHVARPSAVREQQRASLLRLLEEPRAARALEEAELLHARYRVHADGR